MIHGYTHLEDPLSDISGNFVPHTDTLYRIVIGIIRKVILPYLGGNLIVRRTSSGFLDQPPHDISVIGRIYFHILSPPAS